MSKKMVNSLSCRIDDDTRRMLDEVMEVKGFNGDSQAIRWLIHRYHKKKIGKRSLKCEWCTNVFYREEPDPQDDSRRRVVMACAKCGCDVDDAVNSHTCNRFEERREEE